MLDSLFIKEIISDFHNRQLSTYTRRMIDLACPENKIRTIVGIRRSGKTFTFYQLIDDLLQRGIEKERILFINFEDERFLPLDVADFSIILNTYYEMYPALKEQKVFLFFDEIQNILYWEKFVRRIYDTENVQINITGSSSKLLSKDIATSLRGRTFSFEIFPFGLGEYLRFKKIPLDLAPSIGRARIVHAFEEYLLIGGFPEVLDYSEEFRLKTLQEYFNMILYKDLIERYEIRNHSLVKYLLKFLLANNANPFSVNKFYLDSKSQGYKCAKDTLHNFLAHLEDTFCFSLVSIFSDSLRKRQVNYRKIYAIDHGLVTATTNLQSFNTGRLLEAMVYNQLRRKYDKEQIYYYKTSTGEEIDFLVLQQGGLYELVQVSETLIDPKTRQREVDSLWLAMQEINLSEATIITRNETNIFTKADRTIYVIPFYAWALG